MRWLDGITDSMDMSLSRLWLGDGQGGLVCCSPWGCKESDMTDLNNKSPTEGSLLGAFFPPIKNKNLYLGS